MDHIHELLAVRSRRFPQLKTIKFQVPNKKRWLKRNAAEVPSTSPGVDFTVNDVLKANNTNRTCFDGWINNRGWSEVKWVDGMYRRESRKPRWMEELGIAENSSTEWSTTDESDPEDSSAEDRNAEDSDAEDNDAEDSDAEDSDAEDSDA
ncbi:hypothetical protein K432DRAFT_379091 [Lepidopterella palustris CBS 459.81]|uniref:Uncharacterized protein n=1 Tax=Lepidopterella palustris CBS 459.81 TaxID=1314670 RepID=A0A8E2EHE4_9PEZI|nr:hypothetical protein K432DRAFT_379091 [Lepidopterella palustris CBS 459.81]